MALTNTPSPVSVARSIGKTSTVVLHGAEKASQTYLQGAFLIDDDAGLMTESTSPIDASAVAKRTLGLALAAATGTTSADVPIAFVGEDVVFKGTLSNNSAGTHTLVQADQWTVVKPTKDSTSGNWFLDAAAVSDTGGALIVGFEDPIGTVDPIVYFIITTPARGTTDASGTFI